MEIRHFRSFVALAEAGSFTAAARQMNIVQSGLSVTIREMEEELGVQLVSRTTRKVFLTEAGLLFLEYVRSGLATLNSGIQTVRSQSDIVRGRLNLGILQSLGPYVDLPAVLGEFRAKYPQVDFTVRSVDSTRAPDLVRSGYVDMSFHAVTSERIPAGIKTLPFIHDSLVAVCARAHPLAKRRSVSLEMLSKEAFVDLTPGRALVALVDQIFAEHRLRREHPYEVSDVQTLMDVVAAALGVAIIPAGLAEGASVSRKLQTVKIASTVPPLPKWRLAVVVRERRQPVSERDPLSLFIAALYEGRRSGYPKPLPKAPGL
jgi:DNA-binding transcriptional LysR family regulator